MSIKNKLFAGLVGICTTAILGTQGLLYVKTKKLITSLKKEDTHTSPILYWKKVAHTGKVKENTSQKKTILGPSDNKNQYLDER